MSAKSKRVLLRQQAQTADKHARYRRIILQRAQTCKQRLLNRIYTIQTKGSLSFDNNWLIKWAISNAQTGIILYLIELVRTGRDKQIDLSVHDNRLIQWAAAQNQTKVVETLLEIAKTDTRIDPGVNDNIAIRTAAASNRVEVVKLLLEASKTDKRINPWAKDGQARRKAAKNGHTEIVQLLDEWKTHQMSQIALLDLQKLLKGANTVNIHDDLHTLPDVSKKKDN